MGKVNRSRKNGFLEIILAIVVAVMASLPLCVFAQVSEDPLDPDNLSAEEIYRPAGSTEGTNTHFAITDSAYLNISLDSSETITVQLSSAPEMVVMHLEPSADASLTLVTIGGFNPLTTYYKYEDNYHNKAEFTTDDTGTYSYQQDLTARHIVFIQPRKSTKFLSDDATGGDCAAIGLWDGLSRTCTLMADLNETVQIDSDNMTIDGNGHTITGFKSGSGIFLEGRSGVTIKNITVANFATGITIYYSSGITVSHVIASNNTYGIFLLLSPNFTIEGSTISDNAYAGIYIRMSPQTAVTNCTFLNNSESGIFGTNSDCIFSGNTVMNSRVGIYFHGHGNIVTSNFISSATSGIHNYGSNASDNIITKNTILNSLSGIYFGRSSNNQAHHNNFIDVTQPIGATLGTYNIFSLPMPIGGNYYSNYDEPGEGCYDINLDGFCDSPYTYAAAVDYLPFTNQDAWSVPVDSIAPSTIMTTAGTQGNNGWYRSDAQITLTAADNVGGVDVKEIHYSIDGSETVAAGSVASFAVSSEGIHNVSYFARDNAGNSETPHVLSVDIDKTPPAISITGITSGDVYTIGAAPTAGFAVTDNLSGVASQNAMMNGGNANNVGVYAYTVDAADFAGNAASASVTFSVVYGFNGFLSPVNQDRPFRLGSTIPVKFQLTDAHGSYLSTAYATITVQQFSADQPAGEPIDATSTSGADSGNAFRYDATDSQYVYNLSTGGLSEGTWWIQAALDDGTVKTAFVSLKVN